MYQLRANQGICPETPSGLVFVPGQSVRAAAPIGFVDVPQELTHTDFFLVFPKASPGNQRRATQSVSATSTSGEAWQEVGGKHPSIPIPFSVNEVLLQKKNKALYEKSIPC